MTLDLTKDQGTLSYKVNDKSFGTAFDDIDIEKEYCLTVEMNTTNDQYIQIIE